MSSPARILIAAAVGLALADASVVTLALPEILVELDTTVEGVAAVLGVYTLVLAVALPPAEWLRRRIGTARLGVAGFAAFAVAGLGCGAVDSLTPLLVLRAAQAIGAAAGLVCGFHLLTAGEAGRRRLWTAVVIFGTAAGPALGGTLTELFDWRAIFLVQAPIGTLAAVACVRFLPADLAEAPPAGEARHARILPRRGEIELGPTAALALVSAALSGVLFLLVLLLVSGWSISPLAAAATVSVLPAAALLGARIPGDPRLRAAAGCGLVGAGVLALAFLTSASVAWTFVPMLLAGTGMGLAFTSLVGQLLPEDTPAETAFLLAIRHGGITLALLLLAPITAAQLDGIVTDTRERGAALVLDAELPPLDKIELANAVTAEFDPVDPRDTLRRSLEAPAADEGLDEADEYAELTRRADETLVRGVDDAFGPAFLITGGLALLGAVFVLPRRDRSATRMSVGIVGAALAIAGCQAILTTTLAPERVAIADPCEDRELPSAGGIEGIAQDVALAGLDRAACEFGSSREELAIAIVDEDAAQEYESEYGVDPRSIPELAQGALGLRPGD
ncbi:MAG TPA: MFS transporter [Solirubrobacterales bacterium]|nr:MFS transporter [Solirubrobacterales bacterium]